MHHGAQDPPDAIAGDSALQGFLADHVARAPGRRPRRDRHDLQPHPFAAASHAKQVSEDTGSGQPITAMAAGHAQRRVGDRGQRQGVSRARPLARRAESTLRPPTLFIRARKPCVRLRLTTEGWYVRFMMAALNEKALH
jgi:hypothetical protein